MGQLINGKNLLLVWTTLAVLLWSSAPDTNAIKCITCDPASDTAPHACDTNNPERNQDCDAAVTVCLFSEMGGVFTRGCDQTGTVENKTICHCNKDHCNSDNATCTNNAMGTAIGGQNSTAGGAGTGPGSSGESRLSAGSWLWLMTLTPLVTMTLGRRPKSGLGSE